MDYKIFYGTLENKIEITEKVTSVIPSGDVTRANLYGDPAFGIVKSIFIHFPNGTVSMYSDKVKINIPDLTTETIIYPVIVAIAKLESDYIQEWVNYHLALGFEKIYLYDNEDTPTYNNLNENVVVTHIPGNNYHKAVQYLALDCFISNYMRNGTITHVAHIDIDEFIVLKKHNNIKDFIGEYIVGDCAGIGMHWKYFGDSYLTEKSFEPVTQRFTRCQEKCDNTIKTIFDVSKTNGWEACHVIYKHEGFFVKSTSGNIINCAHNEHLDNEIIQLNHYKCKTRPEFKYIRTRGRADLLNVIYDEQSDFDRWNYNESEDFYARDFYKNKVISITEYLNSKGFYHFEGHSKEILEQVNDLHILSKGKKYILEIGFNAGHSSCIFLKNGCIVVSFDLGSHDYVKSAKEYIDTYFPGKHNLILGDSNVTIPLYKTDILFDVIFIDGGHDYNIVKADLENCKRFAHADTIFIVDDITYNSDLSYTIGPTKIWNEYVQSFKMKEINHKEYAIGRGMSWGTLSNIVIVYYIYLPIDRNWRSIVGGQLNDFIISGVNGRMFIHICSLYSHLISECKEFIDSIYPNYEEIYTSNQNLYEYPGIKLVYDISQKNPDNIILYIHSKGMVFTYEDKELRTEKEMVLFRNTIYPHKKVLKLFEENTSINKIGLYPGQTGMIYFNFFWIRASYLKNPPEINTDRFYYEDYIENGDYHDCYSLVKENICYFSQPDVMNEIYNMNKELRDISSHFDKHLFIKKNVFEYGTTDFKIDISHKILLNCFKNECIYIPNTDVDRANLFGDPLVGTLKSIFINGKIYKDYTKLFIYYKTNTIYQVDEIPEITKLMDKYYHLEQIISKLTLLHGSFDEERPEQLMATHFLRGKEKVLEIGGNIGRNSLVIASLLNNSENLLTLECDPISFEKLIENKNVNNLNFLVENSALSARKLIQKGWDTIPSDILLEGYTSICSITWNQLKEKYPIDFDTLVLDCEGAFYYILQDFPEILNGINLIIMENDYHEISHKQFINSVLKRNGFNVVYTEGNGWGPCAYYFYEVWKRS